MGPWGEALRIRRAAKPPGPVCGVARSARDDHSPATALHVVGTLQATAVIADGQRLRVDGTAGTVTVIG